MRRSIAVCLLCFGLTRPSLAYQDCSEPDRPHCSQVHGNFHDSDAASECRIEIETFKKEVEEYQQCSKRNFEEAATQYNDAVSNYKSRGIKKPTEE